MAPASNDANRIVFIGPLQNIKIYRYYSIGYDIRNHYAI